MIYVKILDYFKGILLLLFEGLCFIGNVLKEIILVGLLTLYGIIYKIVSIIIGITNLGFVASIVMLVLNIIEMNKTHIKFADTKYFNMMLSLCTIHIIAYFIYKILDLKADILE